MSPSEPSSSNRTALPSLRKSKARPKKPWPYVFAAVVLLLIIIGLWPKPIPVEISAVRYGPLRVTISDQGQTRVRNRYVVSAPAAGQLRRIELKAGAPVEAGVTPLAFLETGAADLLDARSLAQAEARISAAVAAREQSSALEAKARYTAGLAEADFARAEELFRRGGISKQEHEQATMREQAAGADVRASVFALQVAQGEEAQARAMVTRGQSPVAAQAEPIIVTSPVSGRVLRVLQESQRTVTAGVPLLEIGDPTDLEIWIEVLSRDGVAIRPGAEVLLEQWGGTSPLRASVRLVEPSAWTKISALGVEEQRVWVIADFVDPVEKRPTLGDAYRVEASTTLWETPRTLLAPAGALFERNGQWQVFSVEHGRAHTEVVKIGHSDGQQTEILSGLSESSPVIIYPGDRVTDGVRVQPATSAK